MCNCGKSRKLAVEFDSGLLDDFEISLRRIAAGGTPLSLGGVLPSGRFAGFAVSANAAPKIGEVYTGERRNLAALLGCQEWPSIFFTLHSYVGEGVIESIKAGDYFKLPIKAEAGEHGGLDFEALGIAETELVVTQVCKDRIILNFEDVLFFSAVNEKNTSKGGFKDSALSEYLNAEFLDTFGSVKDVLAKNADGKKVSLPTLYEVAADDDFGSNVNWEEEPRQLEYFKRIKNRIRTKDNDTKWWWLSNAANSAYFAGVHSDGFAGSGGASYVTGGVAPAICII